MSHYRKQLEYLEKLATGKIVRIGRLIGGGYAIKIEGKEGDNHATGATLTEAIDAAMKKGVQ